MRTITHLFSRRKKRYSDDHYMKMVENAGVVMYTADTTGTINFVNSLVCELTGFSAEELVGNHFSMLLDSECEKEVSQFYSGQFLREIVSTNQVFMIRTKTGERKWVEQFAKLIITDGTIKGFQCMVKDVTAEKEIQAALAASEQRRKENEYRLTAILENTRTLIFIKDLQGRYITVNRRFREVFNLTDEMVIGKTDRDFNSEERAAHYARMDSQVIAGAGHIESEELVETPGGTMHLLLAKFPLLDEDGKLFGISGIATDITESVNNRKQLENALRETKEAKEIREQFLAGISHETRTPLNGIEGATRLLAETQLDQQQKELVSMIGRSAERLNTMMRDVLDFADIHKGTCPVSDGEIDVQKIVSEVTGRFATTIAKKKLSTKIYIDKHVPRQLRGDRQRLLQILGNLVSNAVKFTERGTITIEVQVAKAGGLEFVVTDTGIGIEPGKGAAIFESFSHACKNVVVSYGGVGLGLSIARALARLQGGDITFESKVGIGSAFRLYMPYKLPATARTVADGDELAQRYFLVAEDDAINRRIISLVLQRAGVRADLVSNGREALEMLCKNKYDLLITDLHMPVMDGYELTREVRSRLQSTIPIVAMTASALGDDHEKCIQAGMNDFLLKPFDFDQLYKKLSFLLPARDTTEKLFSLDLLSELGDEESVMDVIALVLNDVPAELDRLRERSSQNDLQGVCAQAHKLKGSLSLLNTSAITSLLMQIETDARTGGNAVQVQANIREVNRLGRLLLEQLSAEYGQLKKKRLPDTEIAA